MTELFAHPHTLIAGLCAFSLLLISVTFIVAKRIQRQGLRRLKKEITAQNDQIHGSVQEIEARMTSARAMETKLIEKIQLDITHVQSDLEWLTGERMVEQAVELAKAGVQSEDILRETGFTQEDVDIMARFRRH